jgi:A/G-specific adenine glycosylase
VKGKKDTKAFEKPPAGATVAPRRPPKPAYDPDVSQRGTTAAGAAGAQLHRDLLAWYAVARRDLPWRRTRDPYAIWLSEVMLQQTRVDTVIPYYERFLARWPTVHALAEAPLDDVLTMWSGLGYYRRARMMHAAAQQVAAERAGVFPATADELGQIVGIGPYTAGAVASIAFGAAAPLVDGNVVRVFARLFGVEEDVRGGAGLARIWEIATALVYEPDAGAWNQALMELGATVCVPREPRCLVCPVRGACAALHAGTQAELPRLAPKAKPKEELRWALVARSADGDRVLLARRRRDERFGGMWEPPCLPRSEDEAGHQEALTRFAALAGVRLHDAAPPTRARSSTSFRTAGSSRASSARD